MMVEDSKSYVAPVIIKTGVTQHYLQSITLNLRKNIVINQSISDNVLAKNKQTYAQNVTVISVKGTFNFYLDIIF